MRSFEIDHKKLNPNIYYHSRSGLVVTWDIRMKFPNKGEYLSPDVIHTIEHTLAKFLRDRLGNYKIVGIFPMGCQTGFYVLTRFVSKSEIRRVFVDYIMTTQRLNRVPGATEMQCGQYELQNLPGAKEELLDFYENVLRYTSKALNYNTTD